MGLESEEFGPHCCSWWVLAPAKVVVADSLRPIKHIFDVEWLLIFLLSWHTRSLSLFLPTFDHHQDCGIFRGHLWTPTAQSTLDQSILTPCQCCSIATHYWIKPTQVSNLLWHCDSFHRQGFHKWKKSNSHKVPSSQPTRKPLKTSVHPPLCGNCWMSSKLPLTVAWALAGSSCSHGQHHTKYKRSCSSYWAVSPQRSQYEIDMWDSKGKNGLKLSSKEVNEENSYWLQYEFEGLTCILLAGWRFFNDSPWHEHP